jgi:hypothetical protein
MIEEQYEQACRNPDIAKFLVYMLHRNLKNCQKIPVPPGFDIILDTDTLKELGIVLNF